MKDRDSRSRVVAQLGRDPELVKQHAERPHLPPGDTSDVVSAQRIELLQRLSAIGAEWSEALFPLACAPSTGDSTRVDRTAVIARVDGDNQELRVVNDMRMVHRGFVES